MNQIRNIRMNPILATDSYKLTHRPMYPKNTETVYSYFESRQGAAYPYTVFFGLQAILNSIRGHIVRYGDLDEAFALSKYHFGGPDLFNYQGWNHILEKHHGSLPLRIRAVPEGMPIPVGNVLMTVENTDPECFWLTNAMESLLTHVWYPSTVATRSRVVKEMIAKFLDETGGSRDGLGFMLHDFGYRGAATHDAAAIGGAGHLVNFVGTDTLPAMQLAIQDYRANPETLAFSVPATEHSVMTSLGREDEMKVVHQLLEDYPKGIISVVSDSYDIYNFINTIGGNGFKEKIKAREGKFVVRPDSLTTLHTTPEDLVLWIMKTMWFNFGGTTNEKGYKVLDPHVGVLWGDGIEPEGIEAILQKLKDNGFAAENMVFGMGGGLLQKLNRDTQRFAFKSSAQQRDGQWHDVFKEPLDTTKRSKSGRLDLYRWSNGKIQTIKEGEAIADGAGGEHLLRTVFEDGNVIDPITFDGVRKNAALSE